MGRWQTKPILCTQSGIERVFLSIIAVGTHSGGTGEESVEGGIYTWNLNIHSKHLKLVLGC
jgi:hypothetical protein